MNVSLAKNRLRREAWLGRHVPVGKNEAICGGKIAWNQARVWKYSVGRVVAWTILPFQTIKSRSGGKTVGSDSQAKPNGRSAVDIWINKKTTWKNNVRPEVMQNLWYSLSCRHILTSKKMFFMCWLGRELPKGANDKVPQRPPTSAMRPTSPPCSQPRSVPRSCSCQNN